MAVPWFSAVTRLPLIGKQLFLLFKSKREVVLAAQAIADELELNADSVAPCEPHGAALHARDVTMHFFEWETHSGTARSLSHAAAEPGLWRDVTAAYSHMRQSVAVGAYPPTAAHLRELAERLRRAKM